MLETTPLLTSHRGLDARLVNFAGWEMPVLYGSIRDEVLSVRHRAGIFDVSHMGRLSILGPDRLAFLDHLLSANLNKLRTGQVRYTMMLRPNGTVIDDLLVTREQDQLRLCVNASNFNAVGAWLDQNRGTHDVQILDETKSTAMIALQGPMAIDALKPMTDAPLETMRRYRSCQAEVLGTQAVISSTGYTGEDGFEIVISAEDGCRVWDALASVEGVSPAGLGARDILRLEASMPLFGHELTELTTPLDAGLDSFVDWDSEFIGHSALTEQKERGLKQRLVGLVSEGPRIPRQDHSILWKDRVVGRVVSGTSSPTLGHPIATAYIDSDVPTDCQDLDLDIRGRLEAVREIKMPFYKTSHRRVRKNH